MHRHMTKEAQHLENMGRCIGHRYRRTRHVNCGLDSKFVGYLHISGRTPYQRKYQQWLQ